MSIISGQAAATGGDKDAALNKVSSAFSDSTKSFKGKKPGVIADVDVVVFVNVAVDIILVCTIFRHPSTYYSVTLSYFH